MGSLVKSLPPLKLQKTWRDKTKLLKEHTEEVLILSQDALKNVKHIYLHTFFYLIYLTLNLIFCISLAEMKPCLNRLSHHG